MSQKSFPVFLAVGAVAAALLMGYMLFRPGQPAATVEQASGAASAPAALPEAAPAAGAPAGTSETPATAPVSATPPPPENIPAPPPAGTARDIAAGKGLGSPSAPIHMEVFSDYQCPACRELYFQTVRQVISNYVASGKVYLIHRDFPLESIHPYARKAARYANAAAAVNRLEQVTTALYDRQAMWSADGNVELAVASVLTPGEMNRVRQLAESGALDAQINADMARGGVKNVRSTPTTLITHRGREYELIPGVIPYPILQQFLEELLRK